MHKTVWPNRQQADTKPLDSHRDKSGIWNLCGLRLTLFPTGLEQRMDAPGFRIGWRQRSSRICQRVLDAIHVPLDRHVLIEHLFGRLPPDPEFALCVEARPSPGFASQSRRIIPFENRKVSLKFGNRVKPMDDPRKWLSSRNSMSLSRKYARRFGHSRSHRARTFA